MQGKIERPLGSIFGDSPEIRVTDFLREESPRDTPIDEIVRFTSLNKDIVQSTLSKLLNLGLVEETRKLRRAQFYKLSANEAVLALMNFMLLVLKNRQENLSNQ